MSLMATRSPGVARRIWTASFSFGISRLPLGRWNAKDLAARRADDDAPRGLTCRRTGLKLLRRGGGVGFFGGAGLLVALDRRLALRVRRDPDLHVAGQV